MPSQFDPPSGTRDFLAAELERRDRAFAVMRSVFDGYGFEPLQTPAFERLEVLLGKYGDDGDKLIFKILRRGEHEASGEADLALALRPDGAAGAGRGHLRQPAAEPYHRYAIGPVWRADRPGKGRFREFAQCDLDTVGSRVTAGRRRDRRGRSHDGLTGLGVTEFPIQLNSRRVLHGLLDVYGVPASWAPAC